MSQIQERGSTHVYKVNKISKEEVESMVTRCVYEEAPFCSAACPLKLDVRAMFKAAAAGDFKKALLLYEKAAPFPLIVSAEVSPGIAIMSSPTEQTQVMASSFSRLRLPRSTAAIMPASSLTGINAPDRPPT